jgi:hypothetical protein
VEIAGQVYDLAAFYWEPRMVLMIAIDEIERNTGPRDSVYKLAPRIPVSELHELKNSISRYGVSYW